MRPLLVSLVLLAGASQALAQPRVSPGPALTVIADGDVVVRFAGMSGGSGDWIGIAPPDSPPTQYAAYQYTSAARQGTLTFANLAPGDWVARAYFGASSYSIRAQSTPFHVAERPVAPGVDPSLRVSADGATAYVRFSGLSGAATDWIAIAPVGAPPQSYQAWRYTSGAREGVFEFADLPPGRYEARVFLDWSGTSSYTISGHSAPFWVAPAGCVCGDAAAVAR